MAAQTAGIQVVIDMPEWLGRLLSRENLWALVFCLILIALVILTSDINPTWIYQGF